jgi:hypothetical protein
VEFCKEAPEADECRVYEDWDLPFHFGDSYVAAGMSTVFPITVFLCNVVWQENCWKWDVASIQPSSGEENDKRSDQ